MLATDLCDLEWRRARIGQQPPARVGDDFAIITRWTIPTPDRFVRDITVFVRDEHDRWRRDDERHDNVLIDVSAVPALLARGGFYAALYSSPRPSPKPSRGTGCYTSVTFVTAGSAHASICCARFGRAGFHLRRRSDVGFVLAVALSAATAGAPRSALANSYPGYVHSHYVTTTSTSALNSAGCNLGSAVSAGHAPTDAFVVLAFGYPYLNGSTWGVLLNTSTFPFVDLATVATLAEQFAWGYWNCSPSSSTLTLAIGENSSRTTDDSGVNHYYFNSANGTAWADMVDSVNAWLVFKGFTSAITAAGGADIENASAWQTYAGDRAWADAYGAASPSIYFNFGDAAGCSQTSYNNSVTCNSGFTQQNFWYLSWGASAAWPAPEIYNDTNVTVGGSYASDPNARQWEMIKRYGVHYESSTMTYRSSVSQRTACNQRDSCGGTNNSPSDAWGDFYNALNHDAAPSETGQSIRWTTDFEWGLSPCSLDPTAPGAYPC